MSGTPSVLPSPSDEDAASGRARRRLLAVLWCMFWILMFAIALQDHFRNYNIRWWEPVLWEGSSAFAATVWLIFLYRDTQRSGRDLDRPLRWFARQLKWFPLIAIVFVATIYSIRHGFYAVLGMEYRHGPWGKVFLYESIKLLLFLSLWMGIVFALESFAQWQHQRRQLVVLQRSLAESQLAQLKSQLRPHFLFNALNTISSVMQVDVARADRLLTRLADLLRVTLRSDQEELTTLQQELHVLRLYAEIMEERFAERVDLAWQIEADISNAMLPTMLLQPLLENAFKHGVEREGEKTYISIVARRSGQRLEVKIVNTGTLLPGHTEGIGMRNVRERLRVHYADTASVELSGEPRAVQAKVVLPWQERGK